MTSESQIQRSDLLFTIVFRACPKCKRTLKHETIENESCSGACTIIHMCQHCKEEKKNAEA